MINNGFSNLQVDQEIQKYRTKKQDDASRINKINVFYENQMTKANKIDERVIKNIVSRNVQCSNVNDRLNLIIYYKNKKSKQLVIKSWWETSLGERDLGDQVLVRNESWWET